MAYEIGTATDYKDLLDRLRLFLTDPARGSLSAEGIIENDPMASGEGWTVERWDTNFDSDNGYELILNGPGSAGADEVLVGIQTYYDAGDDYYNWKLCGFTGFVSGQTLQNQPGCTQGCWPKILLWDSTIDYWFLGNSRRFVGIAKVSNTYEMFYLGFALPYGLPTQFPYPLVVGGSFSGTSMPRYSSIDDNHRGFANPYGDGTYVCTGSVDSDADSQSSLKILQGTTWIAFRGRISAITGFNINCVWPYISSTYDYDPDAKPYNIFWTGLKENLDGSYPIFPLIMTIENPNDHILGELQGCYAVPGFGGIAAEDTFTISGDTYIAFPIVTSADRGDFMCIKKE